MQLSVTEINIKNIKSYKLGSQWEQCVWVKVREKL